MKTENNTLGNSPNISPVLLEEAHRATRVEFGKALIIAEKHHRELGTSDQSALLQDSLNSINSLLHDSKSKNQTANEILYSLINRLPTNKSKQRKSGSFSLLCFLIESHIHLFTKTFRTILSQRSSHTKLLKFSDFLFQIIEQQRTFLLLASDRPLKSSGIIEDCNIRTSIPSSIRVYHQMFIHLFPVLVEAAEATSARSGLHKIPTRLSLSLLQTSLNVTRYFAAIDSATSSQSLFSSKKVLVMLILYREYYQEHFPTFDIALTHVLEFIEFFWSWNETNSSNQEMISHKDALCAVALRWEEYIDVIMSHSDKKRISNICRSRLRHHLEATTNKEIQSDSNLLHHHFICIALSIGKHKSLQQFTIDLEEFRLLQTTQDILVRTENQSFQRLASILFQRLIGTYINDKDSEEQIEKLFLLLDEQDFVSDSIIDLLSNIIYKDTNHIPRVFNNLNAKKQSTKENSIKLLCAIFRISRANNPCKDTKSIHFQQQIVSQVLIHLDQFTISLRDAAEELFAFIRPSVLFPQLVEYLTRNNTRLDARMRSIVQQIYTKSLLACKYPLEAIEVVLSSLRHCNISSKEQNIHTPADIGSTKETGTVNEEQIRLLLKPVKEWCELLPVELHEPFLRFLVSYFFDHPESTEIVAFASKCSNFFLDHGLFLISLINEKMDTKNNVPSSNNIFTRLSPMLLLRILPLSVYQKIEENVEGKTIKARLFSMFTDTNEVKELRRISAELLARFTPGNGVYGEVKKKLLRESQLALDGTSKDFDSLKLTIFYVCNTMSIYSESPEFVPHVKEIFFSLFDLLSLPSAEEELQKLQQGCMDAQGIILKNILCICDITLCETITAPIFQQEKNGDSIKLLSAYIKILPTLSGEQLRTISEILLERILSVLYSAWKLDSRDSFSPLWMSASLQLIFVIVFHMKNGLESHTESLFRCSLDACKHAVDRVRMGGLKVLGALMGRETFEEFLLNADHMQQLSFVLESLANIEPSPAVRELAETLLFSMTKSSEK